MSPALLLNPFILLAYLVLLHKMQISHVAWNQLGQLDVICCLIRLDWQIIWQDDSAQGKGYIFMVFCDAIVKYKVQQTWTSPNLSVFQRLWFPNGWIFF